MSSSEKIVAKGTNDGPAPDLAADFRSCIDEKQNMPSNDADKSLGSIGAAAAQATFPSWTSIVLMVSLIFGGCCANVFALEAIIKEQPSAGPLITSVQFILTSLFTLPNFFSLSAGPRSFFLNPRAIPLRSWVVYTAYFVTINMLNNWAFAYRISVPVHIIVRSGGPVASMIIGYLYNGRQYSQGQIMAVILLTIGAVGAALADTEARGHSTNTESAGNDSSAMMNTILGFSILALAMILSAFQGLFADRLYEYYGRNHWKEALFYSHTLSLPLFITAYPQISSQWQTMLASPPLLSQTLVSTINIERDSSSLVGMVSSTAILIRKHVLVRSLFANVPVQAAFLLVNALTQFLCIRGVHLLSAKTSSLTVTIVLNVRKLVSLLLSIYLFGNKLAPGVLLGAGLVFAGGGLYGFEGARLREKTTFKKD